jgi:hypothetical protein
VVAFVVSRERPCLPDGCESVLVLEQRRQATSKPVLIYFNAWATSDLQGKLADDVLLDPSVQSVMGRFVQLEVLKSEFSDKGAALLELGYIPNGSRINMPSIYFFDAQKRRVLVLERTDLASTAASPTGVQDFVKKVEEAEEIMRVRAEEEEEEEDS